MKAKDETPVRPFSNTTESEWWKERNCYQCSKYEMESESEEEAGCPLAWNIDIGFLDGTMPLWAAEEIGYERAGQSIFVMLDEKCRKIINN